MTKICFLSRARAWFVLFYTRKKIVLVAVMFKKKKTASPPYTFARVPHVIYLIRSNVKVVKSTGGGEVQSSRNWASDIIYVRWTRHRRRELVPRTKLYGKGRGSHLCKSRKRDFSYWARNEISNNRIPYTCFEKKYSFPNCRTSKSPRNSSRST